MSIKLNADGTVTIAASASAACLAEGVCNSSLRDTSACCPVPAASSATECLEQKLEAVRATFATRTGRTAAWYETRLSALLLDADGFKDERAFVVGGEYDRSTYTDANGKEWYPWVYGKLLTHDSTTLFVDKDEADQLIAYIQNPTKTGVLPLSAGSKRQHADPGGALGVEPVGRDHYTIPLPQYVPAAADAGFAEMMEVYAMAVVRDVDFEAYATDPTVATAVNGLNQLTQAIQGANWPLDGGAVTAKTLFRGTHPDEHVGPYVSQFLLRDFEAGNLSVVQKYALESDAVASATKAGVLGISTGSTAAGKNTIAGATQRVYSGRVLGSVVHNDPAYSIYFNAYLVGRQGPIVDEDFDTTANATLVAGGGMDVLTMLGAVTRGALRAALLVKWQETMKIRPETYAARCEHASELDTASAAAVPWFTELKAHLASTYASDILGLVRSRNSALAGAESLFLPLVYPEGSPTHPSVVAGHATIAGACCTVLKAVTRTHDASGAKVLWSDVFQEVYKGAHDDTGGSGLVHVTTVEDPTVASMTVVGEYNKLASNVALGRDMAGVHYRNDGAAGLAMGEAYAISYLQTTVKSYYSEAACPEFVLEKFDGSLVKITAAGVGVF